VPFKLSRADSESIALQEKSEQKSQSRPSSAKVKASGKF
jgi:hypothetical protein